MQLHNLIKIVLLITLFVFCNGCISEPDSDDTVLEKEHTFSSSEDSVMSALSQEGDDVVSSVTTIDTSSVKQSSSSVQPSPNDNASSAKESSSVFSDSSLSSSESSVSSSDTTLKQSSSVNVDVPLMPIEREENRDREKLDGQTLISTNDWRDSTRYIFHEDSLYTYNLLLSPSDLATIDADPAAEEYVSGSIVLNGDTVPQVQIRYKGSLGAWWPCAKENSVRGSKQCKLSMKVKFNTAQHQDRRFYGLKKLQFHSMNHNPSYMSERFAYKAYREMGALGPRATHVRLLINGKLEGLYLLVEQIDGRFTRYHLNDDEGNVYKDYWPLPDETESKPNALTDMLKTNEEEEDHTVIVAYEKALLAVDNTDDFKAFMEEKSALTILIRQIVTAHSVLDYDGPYVGIGSLGHNSYSVILPKSKRIVQIPWDTDMSEEYQVNLGHGYWPELLDGWMVAGYPGCPVNQSTLFEKYWFCYPDIYETVFEDLQNRIQNKRDDLYDTWESMIRPVVQEMEDNNITVPNNIEHMSISKQSVSIWEQKITDFKSMMQGQDGKIEEMKQSLGL